MTVQTVLRVVDKEMRGLLCTPDASPPCPFDHCWFPQPRKKVDSRVRTQIENGVKLGHRSMFVVVGDRGKEAVVNLHYILSKARVKAQPSVLWCFKKELGFST